jgi:spore coat protein U-like protein
MRSLFRIGNQPAEFRPSLASLFAAIAMAICGLAIGPLPAEAGTATGTLTVQLTITSACTIGAATLNFGSDAGTSLLTTALTANTTVSVTCTNGSPYAIGMGQGSYYSTTNRMANGTNYIGYSLYQNSTLTEPWTTAASSTTCTTTGDCYLGTGNGTAQTVTIYGQVPTVAVAPASGSYSDTVVMTIMY